MNLACDPYRTILILSSYFFSVVHKSKWTAETEALIPLTQNAVVRTTQEVSIILQVSVNDSRSLHRAQKVQEMTKQCLYSCSYVISLNRLELFKKKTLSCFLIKYTSEVEYAVVTLFPQENNRFYFSTMHSFKDKHELFCFFMTASLLYSCSASPLRQGTKKGEEE